MGNFRNFIEVKMGDANAMAKLDKHPMREQSTFGVEIEFLYWDEEAVENGETGHVKFDPDDEPPFYSEIEAICRESGYSVTEGDSGKTIFGFGLDGHDVDYGLPVLELRTCPLPATDESFKKFAAFLNRIHEFVGNNPHTKFTAHTGLHIHVGGPRIQNDIFSKLSTAIGVDEGQIWDDLASTDRDFGRFALMNHHEDYEGYNKWGVHQKLVRNLRQEEGYPKTQMFTLKQLSDEVNSILQMSGQGRNIGTNFTTEQPTVEFRYLTSALLENSAGVQKVMEYIRYFINQTNSQASKNQIKFQHENHTVIFTRLANGMIRMDTRTQERNHGSSDYYKKANVSTPNINNADARKIDLHNRPPDVSMKKWKSNDPGSFYAKLNNMSRKTNWKYRQNTDAANKVQQQKDAELLKSLGADYQ